mgnify:CR=1 FL=1
MNPPNKIGICTNCHLSGQTYFYHISNSVKQKPDGKVILDQASLSRVELCKPCYNSQLAIEQVNYWKDHISEEQKRRNL